MRNCFVDQATRAIADLTPEMVPGTWTITRINVPHASRGQGHGSKMLRRICDEADSCGVTLTLEILPSGPLDYDSLESWYERYGFRPSRRYPGFYFRRPQCPTPPKSSGPSAPSSSS